MKWTEYPVWEIPNCDLRVITSHGEIHEGSGDLIMGLGHSYEAKYLYPALPSVLGKLVSSYPIVREDGVMFYLYNFLEAPEYKVGLLQTRTSITGLIYLSIMYQGIMKMKEVVASKGYKVVGLTPPGLLESLKFTNNILPFFNKFLDSDVYVMSKFTWGENY